MNAQNKDIAAIDVIKFLMAFAVIAIHSGVAGLSGGNVWPKGVAYVIRLAVPFFFITSGCLLSYKIVNKNFSVRESKRYFRKRSLQLFRIFVCWLIIYLPVTICAYREEGTSFLPAVAGYLYKVVMSGHSLWAWQLWFLYSMAWVLLLYSFIRLSKRNLIILTLFFAAISMANVAFYKYDIAQCRTAYILTHNTLGGGVFT